MPFTAAEAEVLRRLPKKTREASVVIDLSVRKTRIDLYAPREPLHDFFIEITRSNKVAFMISLHHQHEPSHEGLLRIDYRGGHQNPVEVTSDVPPLIATFAGRLFIDEAHIHYPVDGYPSLAWAVPLTTVVPALPTIENTAEIGTAISAFAQLINLSMVSITFKNTLL